LHEALWILHYHLSDRIHVRNSACFGLLLSVVVLLLGRSKLLRDAFAEVVEGTISIVKRSFERLRAEVTALARDRH